MADAAGTLSDPTMFGRRGRRNVQRVDCRLWRGELSLNALLAAAAGTNDIDQINAMCMATMGGGKGKKGGGK